MAQKTRKKIESTYHKTISIDKFTGYNASMAYAWYQNDLETSLKLDEFQTLENWDVEDKDGISVLKTRRGSAYLTGTARGSSSVINRIIFDNGSTEYLITQDDSSCYYVAASGGTPTLIALATGGAFSLTNSTRSEMFMSGDKIYILHPSGNFVIRWTGSTFVAYPMGLAYPWISSVTSSNAGVITGSYTIGIEKVYQASGVDLMASTPNRRIPTSRILAVTGTITSKKIKAVIQATELDNDTLWTHLRFWRSKNKNADYTDAINPIDAQGLDDELYEEALITKAEISAGALTSIATGSTLPLGNVGTQAGKPAGVYTIEVNNLDSVLFNLIGIDRIELLPIPACTVGCFNANRIFFSGVQDSALDDASKNNIWYSEYAGTKYAFQYNPINYIETGRDGQQMKALIAFEKDVIGIKESKTGRIPSSNIDIPWQELDSAIGVRGSGFAAFIPKIGIVALTANRGEFLVFGYDLRWTNIINGRDISRQVNLGFAAATFAYVNGKLIIYYAYDTNGPGTDLSGYALVLHVKSGKGWSTYKYRMDYYGLIYTYSNGTRAGIVAPNTKLIQVEVFESTTDIITSTGATSDVIATLKTAPFNHNNGKSILEMEKLSVSGALPPGKTCPCVPYVNKLPWPNLTSETTTEFIPSPSLSQTYPELADQEYSLYIQPATVGSLKWCPIAGNHLSFKLSAKAPSTIRSISLDCLIDENGIGYGAFDPLGQFPTTNTDPTWAQ